MKLSSKQEDWWVDFGRFFGTLMRQIIIYISIAYAVHYSVTEVCDAIRSLK